MPLHDVLDETAAHANTLDDLEQRVLSTLADYHNERGNGHIGFVSGIINSDGPEKRDGNLEALQRRTEAIRRRTSAPTFSAFDIMPADTQMRFTDINTLSHESRMARIRSFWNTILTSGYITDIFFTPGWERSTGSVQEFLTALGAHIAIHFTDDDGNESYPTMVNATHASVHYDPSPGTTIAWLGGDTLLQPHEKILADTPDASLQTVTPTGGMVVCEGTSCAVVFST